GGDSREELDYLLRKVAVPFVEVCLGFVSDEDTRTGMDRLPELLAKELTGRRLESKGLPLAIHAAVDDDWLRCGHRTKHGPLCALEQASSRPPPETTAP